MTRRHKAFVDVCFSEARRQWNVYAPSAWYRHKPSTSNILWLLTKQKIERETLPSPKPPFFFLHPDRKSGLLLRPFYFAAAASPTHQRASSRPPLLWSTLLFSFATADDSLRTDASSFSFACVVCLQLFRRLTIGSKVTSLLHRRSCRCFRP